MKGGDVMSAQVFGALVAIKPLPESQMPGRGSFTKTTWSGMDPDDND